MGTELKTRNADGARESRARNQYSDIKGARLPVSFPLVMIAVPCGSSWHCVAVLKTRVNLFVVLLQG